MATDTDKFQSSGEPKSAHEFEFVALYIWLIIDKIEDVVVGSSSPYNYEKSRFQVGVRNVNVEPVAWM